MPEITEEFRGLQLKNCVLGEDILGIHAFDGEDRLGCLFEYRLDLRSDDMDLNFDAIVGTRITVSVELADESARYFNGYICDFSFVGTEHGRAVYSATMRPWPWFLSQCTDYRIFQEMSVPDIIEKVFSDAGFSDYKRNLTGTYPDRTYCVQYGETDFDFVSRLMEQEGIYYYFAHEEGKHELMLVDGKSGHKDIQGDPVVKYFPRDESEALREEDHLQEWTVRKSIVSDAFVNRDYDFEKPKASLESKSSEEFSHQKPPAAVSRERYDYPGGYTVSGEGERYVKNLAQCSGSQHERAFSEGNVRHMASGCTFSLTNYPREDQNREYLIVSVRHAIRSDDISSGGESDEEFYRCWLEVMPSEKIYRSPLLTPKPVVRGPQSAIVVGKSGEEIWCDKYGRVKVQFYWDREGKNDENSSCWVRVSQMWAGKEWGAIHTPRIGQEVLVSFLYGDPDQPLITGGVYNADNMPPYALPNNQTQSGVKSRSTKEANADNFNELRFEDKKDEEEVYFQAEKDLNSLVKNKETRKIGATRTTEIGDPGLEATDKPKTEQDAETLTVHASKKTEIKGNEVYEIAADGTKGREVTIHNGDDKLTVKSGDFQQTVTAGNYEQTVNKDVTQTVETGDITRNVELGKVLEEAAQSIEFKVGQSSIKLEPSKITIKSVEIKVEGTMKAEIKSNLEVKIESGLKTELKGTMTKVEGSGMAIVKGGMVKIN